MKSVVAAAALSTVVLADDPNGCTQQWVNGLRQSTPVDDAATDTPPLWKYDLALRHLDIDALKQDLEQLFTASNDCWPADGNHYGPFFIRLAWHCSGSYRRSDGLGGCGGGRQRFEPERSWDDNTNLDKARTLLWPIKEKYGDALSWGDLFIAAGTTALRSMGTPITQLCFGRADDADGTKSLALGPSDLQREVAPCEHQGECQEPLGSTTIGLIYLNPEGPLGNPDPALSVNDVRDSFERMGHSDRATVALIGGGHAFGKTHGACPDGPGDAPNVAYNSSTPSAPWQGKCGTGRGADAFTSGFEGPWTTSPTSWDNEFFQNMLDHEWEKHMGPGGHWQWRIKDAPESLSGLMRLTSDVALLHDDKYLEIVKEFATDMDAFDKAFDEAWFDLTTTNGGGVWADNARCDNGVFPDSIRSTPIMLDQDVVV